MRILAIILFIGLASNSLANVKSAEECLSFSDDALRLECYDKIHGYVDNSNESSVSLWQFQEEIDGFSDKNVSLMALFAEAGYEREDDAPKVIGLKCNGNGSYNVFVRSDGFLSNEHIEVKYRFSGEEVVEENWRPLADGTGAVGGKFKDKALRFETKLATGKDFIFQVTDYRGVTNMASFKNSKDPNFDFILNGCKK